MYFNDHSFFVFTGTVLIIEAINSVNKSKYPLRVYVVSAVLRSKIPPCFFGVIFMLELCYDSPMDVVY